MNRLTQKMIGFALCATMAVSLVPFSALADSVGSDASDPAVGQDTAQGASTKYTTDDKYVDTEVYLTKDDGDLRVSVPKDVILSGTLNQTSNKYEGKYRVSVEGDVSGNKTLTVEPDDSDLELTQRGKTETIPATVSQNKTVFTADEILAATTTDGTVSADYLSAGSWHGRFVIDINLSSETRYYSTLAKAVADANNLTLENSDADVDTAAAEVRLLANNTAYIRLLKNVTGVPALTLNNDTIFNMDDYSATFSSGISHCIMHNGDLKIYDGTINATNVNYDIRDSKSLNNNSLFIKNVTLNNTVTSASTTNCIPIDFSGTDADITNLSINALGTGSASRNINGFIERNPDCEAVLTNYHYTADNGFLGGTVRASQLQGTTTFNEPVVYIDVDATLAYGLQTSGSTPAVALTINNVNLYLNNRSTADVGFSQNNAMGIIARADTVEINGANVYATATHKDTGCGISLNYFEEATIQPSDKMGVDIWGKNYGVGAIDSDNANPAGTAHLTIRDAKVSALNHVAYFGTSADLYNVSFLDTHSQDYTAEELTETDKFGLYCYGHPNAVINMHNCEIGTATSTQRLYGQLLTSQCNYGYSSIGRVNLYDCTLYNYGNRNIFKYNFPDANHKANTKFYIYGDTKFLQGSSLTELPKATLAQSIATWKTHTHYKSNEQKYYTWWLGDSYILDNGAEIDEDTGEILDTNLADSTVDVYDCR